MQKNGYLSKVIHIIHIKTGVFGGILRENKERLFWKKLIKMLNNGKNRKKILT